MFEDLYDYMNSLQKMITLRADKIYPAHGPVLHNATEILENYVAHRNLRESQVSLLPIQGLFISALLPCFLS